MKMRKIFAILLSTALLMALAIVPANAAYKFDATPVTVNEDVAEAGEKTFEVTGNYAKVDFTVTSGSVAVLFGNNVTVDTLTVYFDYVSETEVTAHIRGASLVTLENNIPLDTNVISLSAIVADGNVIVNINGIEKTFALTHAALTASPLATTGLTGVKVAGNSRLASADGTATIATFESGTAKASFDGADGTVDVIVNPTPARPENLEVTIEMGSFDFTYTPETYKWDAAAGDYVIDDTIDYGWTWEDGADKITVTNLSTVAVDVEVTSTVAANTDGVTFSLDVTEDTLDAVTSEEGEAVCDYVVITGTIGGVPGSTYNVDTNEDGTVVNPIGTITVNVYRA